VLLLLLLLLLLLHGLVAHSCQLSSAQTVVQKMRGVLVLLLFRPLMSSCGSPAMMLFSCM
jgi:hypothetical protein